MESRQAKPRQPFNLSVTVGVSPSPLTRKCQERFNEIIRLGQAMKINRHGRAKVLTVEEIQLLFSEGLTNPRDRALFGICLYTACRINEACTLRLTDVYNRKGLLRDEIIIRKENTKGKLATRCIPLIEDLRSLLLAYYPSPRTWFLFPSRNGTGHINPDSAARILREACERLDIEGVSTHSFRRTALTQMSNACIPLRVIQEVSGHRTLDELQKYLEVKPEQVRGAVSSLSMLSHVGKPSFTAVREDETARPEGFLAVSERENGSDPVTLNVIDPDLD